LSSSAIAAGAIIATAKATRIAIANSFFNFNNLLEIFVSDLYVLMPSKYT
jgi:hypothetical protein